MDIALFSQSPKEDQSHLVDECDVGARLDLVGELRMLLRLSRDHGRDHVLSPSDLVARRYRSKQRLLKEDSIDVERYLS